jgi:hypothetical protein
MFTHSNRTTYWYIHGYTIRRLVDIWEYVAKYILRHVLKLHSTNFIFDILHGRLFTDTKYSAMHERNTYTISIVYAQRVDNSVQWTGMIHLCDTVVSLVWLYVQGKRRYIKQLYAVHSVLVPKKHILNWNPYIYNWFKQYQTKMHLHYLMSTIVDTTMSRFKRTPLSWFSNVFVFIETINFILNWFQKWKSKTVPMLLWWGVVVKHIFINIYFNCLIW